MKHIISTTALVLAVTASTAALAHPESYSINLSGPNESPANASPGIGTGTVIIDPDAFTMDVQVSFSGILGNTTASHIHCCTPIAGIGTAGVATPTPTFPDFPLSTTSGTYSHHFDMTQASSYNAAFISLNGNSIANTFSAFLTGINAGKAYLNIHTSNVPAGEIRGFLVPTAVPLPAAIWLFGSALGLLAVSRKAKS